MGSDSCNIVQHVDGVTCKDCAEMGILAGLVVCVYRLRGVSGTSELVAPSSAAKTSTHRLKVVAVNKLE